MKRPWTLSMACLLLFGCDEASEFEKTRDLSDSGTACVQADGQLRIDFAVCVEDCMELRAGQCDITRTGAALEISASAELWENMSSGAACSNNGCVERFVTCEIPAGDAPTELTYAGQTTTEVACN